jgi:16S rRNA (guanine527-N7)-methyltransferase
MDAARIAELLRPFLGRTGEQQLTPSDLEHISMYIDILVRWNARINLTAIRDPEEIVTRHFGESLLAASYLFPRGPAAGSSDQGATAGERIAVADIGSGAGFPGVPLKLWAPSIQLTLIESNQKKSIFLREIVRSLTLTNVDIEAARAETLPPASFDVVTLRAAERFATVLPIAGALVKPGGRLALLIGSAQVERARSLVPEQWLPPIPVPLSHSRVLFATRL